MAIERPFKSRNGHIQVRRFNRQELEQIIDDSFDTLIKRSAIVECETCGRLVLVNKQDLHLVRRCDKHK